MILENVVRNIERIVVAKKVCVSGRVCKKAVLTYNVCYMSRFKNHWSRPVEMCLVFI